MHCNHAQNGKRKNNINLYDTLLTGFKTGTNTTWILAKIVVPVYFFITFLKHTGFLDWMANAFLPLMNLFGLPGEAALVLVLGNFLNLYAAIGAIASLTLTSKQITILAIMLSFSHSLFMETAVVKKAGVNVAIILFIRIGLALISGILLNIFI
ncbi:nucleoside recognition domain-containing protein [Clostridiisalibacter paucivorans]|uniref:nucleoside recognition domain-containing protein n=1 Tax=Clostridiisalibacter paucivorans TaxID=408753 RepID=UPI000B0962A2|nr:nucleoside recognition domain-containing protein [Clostridiisalibacter paucivorans]